MNTCESCRYFSNMIAKWHANGQTVKALCLNKESPYSEKYQQSYDTCLQYRAGVPVDARYQPKFYDRLFSMGRPK